jgi:CheY-like chemotaxis protein
MRPRKQSRESWLSKTLHPSVFSSHLCLHEIQTSKLSGSLRTERRLFAGRGNLSPDLILMDIGLPGALNGIEVAREIRQSMSESKIVFLSKEISVEVVQSALELGTLGQVRKSRAGSDLLAAISARGRFIREFKLVLEVHLRGPSFPALERRLFLGLWRIIFQKLLDCFRDVFLLLVRFGLRIQSLRRNSPPYESFLRRIVHAEV